MELINKIKLKLRHLLIIGLAACKISLEDEGANFDDIVNFRKLIGDIPLYVKIGGVGAKTEIKELYKIGVDGIIAPLIESGYGVEVFIDSLKSIFPKAKYNSLRKIINIESVTGYDNSREILKHKDISHIVIGRSDLTKSLNKKINDPSINKIVTKLSEIILENKKYLSIGGGITPDSAVELYNTVAPNFINTRNFIIQLSDCNDIFRTVREALYLEMDLLALKHKNLKEENEALKIRYFELKKRINN